MTTALVETTPATYNQTVVASYLSHAEAEAAVRRLAAGNIPVEKISIIGRNFETHEDVQGFYRPADAALDGAGTGAWYGGIFGLLLGAMGLFIMPAVGAVVVLGPLSGLIAGAIGGAGVGALISGLVALGVPRHQAIKYQARLQAGEFLVIVHGTSEESSRAHALLEDTTQTHLQVHSQGPVNSSGSTI